MTQSGEVADLMVKEGIQVTEEAAKLAALGAKNLAAIVMALLKEDNKMQGMTNLKNLLKSEKPLCILQIKKEDLPKFKKNAKNYGVLFTAVSDKQDKSGFLDIIAKQEDVPQLNHIIDKLGLNAPEKSEKSKTDDKKKAADKDISQKDKDGKNSKTRESENLSEKRYTARAGKKDEKVEEAKQSVKEKVREIKAVKNPTPDKVPDLVRASRKSAEKVNMTQRVVVKAVKKAKDEVTKTTKQATQASKSNKQKER